MARRTRLNRPPRTDNPALDGWLANLYSEINNLPNFSIISTTVGPENTELGDIGTLAINVGDGTGHLWVKHGNSGDSIGWFPVQAGAPDGLYTNEPGPGAQNIAAAGKSIFTGWQFTLEGSALSASVSGNNFTASSEGTYRFDFQSSFSADVNTGWECHLFQNNSELSFGCHRKMGASSDIGSMSFVGALVNASSGDTFDVRISHDGVGTKTFSAVDSQFIGTKVQ